VAWLRLALHLTSSDPVLVVDIGACSAVGVDPVRMEPSPRLHAPRVGEDLWNVDQPGADWGVSREVYFERGAYEMKRPAMMSPSS
jgi:hypothetical protein